MKIGLDLAHNYKQMEKSPLFNFIYCYASGQINQTRNIPNKYQRAFRYDCDSLSKDGIWHMQHWPLELINYPQFNSDQLDVQINVPLECAQPLKSLKMLPPDERSTKNWNSRIYDFDDGDGLLKLIQLVSY
jgi:hypothetical protein